MKTNTIFKAGLLLTALCFGGQLSAREHTDIDADSALLNNIYDMDLSALMNLTVTTAGKTEQKISDIPASVVVISKSEIETYGYQTTTEILSNVLGLYFHDDYSSANFGVRGFMSNQPLKNVILMVDGVSQKTSDFSSNDLWNINVQPEAIVRIEIVRGPMAVLYGNDAFFGAINIITSNGSGSASQAYASYGTRNTIRGGVHTEYADSVNTFTLSAGMTQSDGRDIPFSSMLDSVVRYDRTWHKDATTKDFFKSNNQYINVSGSHKGFYAKASFDYYSRNSLSVLPPVLDTTKIVNSQRVFRSSLGYSKTVNSAVSFDVHTNYTNKEAINIYEKVAVGLNTPRGFLPINQQFGYGPRINTEMLNEASVIIKPSEKLNITLGSAYSIKQYTNLVDVPQLGYNRDMSHTETPSRNLAGYLQAEFKANDKLLFLAGARVDKQFAYDYNTMKFVGTKYKDTSYTYNDTKLGFSPRIAAIFKLNETNVVKAMFSKAISRPSLDDNSFPFWVKHSQLVPQEITTTELNYSTALNIVSINVSGFYNQLNNLIVKQMILNQSASTVTIDYTNAGKMHTMGGELQVLLKPSSKMVFDVSACYQKTTDETYNIKAAYSPALLSYAKASYLVTNNWTVALLGNYVGEMESAWDNTPINPKAGDNTPKGRIYPTTPGYFTLGANTRYDNLIIKGLHASVHATNLTNTQIRYAPTTINNGYLPKGTVETGVQVFGSIGYKF